MTERTPRRDRRSTRESRRRSDTNRSRRSRSARSSERTSRTQDRQRDQEQRRRREPDQQPDQPQEQQPNAQGYAGMQNQPPEWEQQTGSQQSPFAPQQFSPYGQPQPPQFNQLPAYGQPQTPPYGQPQPPQFNQLPAYGQQYSPVAGDFAQQPLGQERQQFDQGAQTRGQQSFGGPQSPSSPGQSASMQFAQQQLVDQPADLYPEQFADHLTEEMRLCLDDCIDVSQVAGWTADRCIEDGTTDPNCARLCNEVSILGSITSQFISRDAENIPAVTEAYIETAETALEELEQYDLPHTNEAVTVIDRSIESTLDALETR